MKKRRYQFDLKTQRFITNRWESTLGQRVYRDILDAAQQSADLRPILEHYVLEHPENIEPYEYPVYPPSAMQENDFWVLTPEDLRGIHFYQEDMQGSHSLAKMQLSLAHFYECRLEHAHISMARLSYTVFKECDLRHAVLAHSEGLSTKFFGCKLQDASFLGSEFEKIDAAGSDFRRVFFGDARLESLHVDYRSRFDRSLRCKWKHRVMTPSQLPDLYHALRLAYQHEDLWHVADRYLYKERAANRKYIRWPQWMKRKSPGELWLWFKDWIWGWTAGYGTRPARLVTLGVLVSFCYAVVYYLLGGPVRGTNDVPNFVSTLYFSFTTFATLGYGDLSYGPEHPWLRLLSTSEAWVGAIFIALFVAVIARKILR